MHAPLRRVRYGDEYIHKNYTSFFIKNESIMFLILHICKSYFYSPDVIVVSGTHCLSLPTQT